MAKKVFVVAFGLLLIYSIGVTWYTISARARYSNIIEQNYRTAQSLDAELGRARRIIDTTSLGLEQTIGRVSQMQDRNQRITELISAIKGAIGKLIRYLEETQGTGTKD